MDISVVVPICNELPNIRPLYAALKPVLAGLKRRYEMILVDDGSTDGSFEELLELARQDPAVKIVRFRRNFGQTAAMSAGIEHASGEVIVTLDGDLQNDPADIPMMLAKLDEGYDLVHGWRKDRQDALVHRKLPSRIANWIIARTTGFPVNDLGCTLKAIRREIAVELRLYGEMHRFIPILAHWQGARCAEVVTRHHARRFGVTKYNIWRTFRVILDLITVKFMLRYWISPMKLFGGLGLACTSASLLAVGATAIMKLGFAVDVTGNPLFLASIFSFIVGLQFFVLGLLGEVAVRIYYESQDKRPYAIRDRWNFATGATTDAQIARSSKAA